MFRRELENGTRKEKLTTSSLTFFAFPLLFSALMAFGFLGTENDFRAFVVSPFCTLFPFAANDLLSLLLFVGAIPTVIFDSSLFVSMAPGLIGPSA